MNKEKNESVIEKVRLTYESKAWGIISKERGRVIAFLIENRNIQNEIRLTVEEISKKTGVSVRTIGRIIDDLEEAELAVQGVRIIMLNPRWIHRGNNIREAEIYKEFDQMMRYYKKGKYKMALIGDKNNS